MSEIEVRFIGGGPLDGMKISVADSAYKITAADREGTLMAIYQRDGSSTAFAFQGFEDNDWNSTEFN